MDMQSKPDLAPESGRPGSRGLVNLQVWDSYLGSDRILDLFDKQILNAATSVRTTNDRSRAIAAALKVLVRSSASPDVLLSEDTINTIVDRVMKRMSAEIIREVAWEVVPELSESIIRQTIEEQKKP